tara:strand:+ start:56 stop:553 length:498 start_codon:yes stop_codon:yes gene_type:complete
MKPLNDLANGLAPEDRDKWIERVTLMTSRLEENDEMRILLEAVAMVSETVDKRLSEATRELKNATSAAEGGNSEKMAKAIVEQLSFPGLTELRTYLRNQTAENDRAAEINKNEDRSLKQAQRILNEMKSLNGKSFFFWGLFSAAIVAGMSTGILSTYIVYNFVLK